METENPDIQGSTIVSIQGLPICSTLSRDTNYEIVSAICAAILAMSKHAVEELVCGKLKRILIDGADGKIILSKIGPNSILCMLVKNDARLEDIFQYFNNNPPKMKEAAYIE